MQSGTVLISLAQTLGDGKSVVAMDISLDKIQEITENSVLDKESEKEMILDGNWFVVAHSDRDEVGKSYGQEEGTLGAAIVEQIKRSGQDSLFFDHGGTSYIIYHSTIQNGWHCISVKDATAVYQSLNLLLAVTIVLVILIVFVLTMIIYRFRKQFLVAQKLNVQLSSTVDIYRSAHDLDIVNDTFSEIRTNESRISDILGTNHENAQVTLIGIMDKLTDPSSKEDIMRFIDFSTIDERMKDQKTITVEFLNTQNLWLRGRFIVSERLADGRVSHVLWMVENIDEEKRRRDMMYEAVKKMNEQIVSVASIYMTVYEVDISEDTFQPIKEQNKEVSDMVGSERDHAQDVIRRVMDNVTAPSSRDEVRKYVDLSSLKRRLRHIGTDTLEFQARSGRWCRARFIASRREEDGEVSHVLWLVEDINMEKTERDRLIDVSQRAIAASEAKSSFLSNMSHEIRTPINAVLGMNEMILRESEDEDILAYSQSIRTAGSTLLGIVNDILDFSKIEAGKMEIVPVDYDLSSVINDLVNMVRSRADEKGLILRPEFDQELPRRLHGDDVRIKQVITNILTNAVKYTEKGSVTFRISFEKIAEEPDSVMILVSVEDTGIGIKPEDMKKLFSEFERIEEERNRNVEGTGLGMTITKRLLEMMGSSLKVESEYGKGSKFSFRLKQGVVKWDALGDYETAYRNAVSKQDRYKERFTAPKALALVVDDNAMNLMVIKSLLKKTLIQVDTAADGDEGLRLCRKKKYDIVFLDHMMPGKDGIETLKELKGEKDNPNLDTPTICLTANAISGARDEYIAAGFDDYLTKPIDAVMLENMLLEYLPKERIEAPSKEDGKKKAAAAWEFPEDFAALKDQELVDTAVGMKNSGSVEIYRSILKVFYEAMDENREELEKSYAGNDIKNYTIKVHAVKSSARIIGAVDIGEDAQALENAGKEGDEAYIRKNHEAFLKKYESLKQLLSPMFDQGAASEEKKEKPEADETLLHSVYAEIKTAAENMDYSALESILAEMGDYSVPESEYERWRDIGAAFDILNYDRIQLLLKDF